jgi:hypothetical protein
VQGLRTITVPRLYIAATKVPIAVETPLGGAVVGGGTTAVLQYADDGKVHPADVALGALLGGGENAAIGGRGWSARRHPIGSAADLRLMARPRERSRLLDRARTSAPQDQRPYERDVRPLQTHYKHAKHFGVTGNWNKNSVDEFDDALRRFVAAPGTVRIDGTWHKQPAIIYADYDRRLTLVCHPDGRYWTAQPSTAGQYWWLWYTHRLGGS